MPCCQDGWRDEIEDGNTLMAFGKNGPPKTGSKVFVGTAKKTPADFIKITGEQFVEAFKDGRYSFHQDIQNEPADIAWWEAHISFIIDGQTGETAGFSRSSSWNTKVEYFRLRREGDVSNGVQGLIDEMDWVEGDQGRRENPDTKI